MSNQSNTSNDKPRTVQDIINDIKEKSADGTYIFRGEPECYPKVSSTLYRECQPVAKVGMERIQRQILNLAEEYDINRLGPSRSQNFLFIWSGGYNPLKYTERQFEILAEIQHWGGETNLIDFTTDYRVALFFACDGHYNEDGRVIIQNRSTIESIIWEPTEPRHRVEAQKSVFVQPPNGFIKPDSDQIICIPKTLKVPILKYLMKQDSPITTKTIYNDLHGLIKIQDRYRDAYVKFYLGVDYEEQGNAAEAMREKHEAYEKAIDYYRDAIDLMPNLVAAHINCGRAHAMLADFDSAIYHFNEAIDWKPDFADAYNNRGNAYSHKGDFDRAIADYNKAMELNPDSAETYCNRGNAYFFKGDLDLAIKSFDIAIKLNLDNSYAYRSRANVNFIKGKLDVAIKDYNKAIELNSDDFMTYIVLSTIYRLKGQFDLAIDSCNKAIELLENHVESSEPYSNLAMVQTTNNSKIITRELAYPMAYKKRGDAFCGKNNLNLAIKDYTKAIALNPDYAEAYYYRATVWLHLREWDKAKSDLSAAQDKGINIITVFCATYGNVANFERITRAQLPTDLAAMLTPQQ